MSTQFDRANRVDVARMTDNMMTGPALDAHALELEADTLGQRLFFDRRGPLACYPTMFHGHTQPRTSCSGIA